MFHPSIEQRTRNDWEGERAELLRRGYVKLPEFVTTETADKLLAELVTLIERHGPTSSYGVYRSEKGSVVVANKLDRESDLLFDFAREPILLSAAAGLLGKTAISLHVEYFDRPVDHPLPAPPHQDHAFYHEHFPDELAISFWIALDQTSSESGLLEYGSPVPTELLPHKKSATLDFSYEMERPDGYTFEQAMVPRGGCIVHHSYAVHRTGVNRSGRPRRAVVFNYRGSPYRENLSRG